MSKSLCFSLHTPGYSVAPQTIKLHWFMKKYLVEKIWLYRKEQRNIVFCIKYVGKSFAEEIELKLKTYEPQVTKGRRFSEKDWYYLQAQTDMPFHYLKLVV